MTEEQLMVEEFHEAFGIDVEEKPIAPSQRTAKLRASLIEEELDELREAFKRNDLIEIADAIADILYVTYGAAASCGIDIELIFAEVHRSNMTKIDGYKREDGKWVKPDNYDPPNLAPLIEEQINT